MMRLSRALKAHRLHVLRIVPVTAIPLYLYKHVYGMATAAKSRREKSAAIPTRFSSSDLARLEQGRELLGLPSRSAFIRQAVLGKLEELEKVGITEIRDVTPGQATKLIQRYLAKNPGTHYVSELIERLGLEPRIAFAAAQKLIDEGRARLGRD